MMNARLALFLISMSQSIAMNNAKSATMKFNEKIYLMMTEFNKKIDPMTTLDSIKLILDRNIEIGR